MRLPESLKWLEGTWTMTSVLGRALAAISILFLASGVVGGARSASADSIDTTALFFDGHNTLYRSPFGAVMVGTSVTLRFRTAHQGATAVSLIVRDPTAPTTSKSIAMTLDAAHSGATYDFWKATIPLTSVGIWTYDFQVQNGSAQTWYADLPRLGFGAAGAGVSTQPRATQYYLITAYRGGFKVPSWLKGAVMYQIFPDRFYNGDKSNDKKVMNPAYAWHATIIKNWYAPEPTTVDYNQLNYYGGDLQGIIDKFSYLKGLGVNVLYLNPIFQAGTNHGYDTANYKLIAPHFGTLKTFKTLIADAHRDHMKVILDGVFNHTSSDSVYFNRYGHFKDSGAYQSQTSPYYNWYTFQKWPNAYSDYFGIDTLPQLSETTAVKNFIYKSASSVAQYWLAQGADGWRLDHSVGKSDAWWQDFRAALKKRFPNDALICECDYTPSISGLPVLGNIAPFIGVPNLLGNMFDGDMNYPFQQVVMSFFADGSEGLANVPFTASQLLNGLLHITELMPPPAIYGSMNVIGTHDTARALSVLSNNVAEMKQLAALQMAWPGMPEIYYGDEAGETGIGSPDTVKREPFPWSHPNKGLQAFYRKVIHLRETNSALQDGSVRAVSANDANRLVAFERVDGKEVVPVMINDGKAAQSVSVPTAGLKKGTTLVDGVSGKKYKVTGSTLTVHVAAMTTAILVP
jgi:glycosidase